MKHILGTFLVIAIAFTAAQIVHAQSAPKPPPAGGTFEQRLKQRKSERNIQIDERDERRLTSRCTDVQQRVRVVQQETTELSNNRNETYEDIDAKLWVTIGRLKLADVDTFDLERQRATLARRVEGFQDVMRYYQQTLDDIAVINCQADVVGFLALLDTARIYYSDIRSRSQDIKDFVLNQIKPTLSGYIVELQPKPATEE